MITQSPKLVHTIHLKAQCGHQVVARISINGFPLPHNYQGQLYVNNRAVGGPVYGDKYIRLVDTMVSLVEARVDALNSAMVY